MCDTCATDSTVSYAVSGMTCGGCAANVTAAVEGLAGVTNVDVDVPAGTVSITASQPVAEDTLREAIEKAGYSLTGAL